MSSPPAADRKVACLICRKRKVACDRKRPKCGLCTRSNFRCEYKASDRTPGLRAGYVAQLEQRLIQLEERVSSIELNTPATNAGQVAQPSLEDPEDVGSPFDAGPPTTSHNPFTSAESVDIVPHTIRSPTPPQMLNIGSAYFPVHPLRFEDLFAYPTIASLCDIWFEKYHGWFPLLHRQSLRRCLDESIDALKSSRPKVFQAIAAATLDSYNQTLPGLSHPTKLKADLSESILLSSLNTPCLDSIQALLILSTAAYGDGRTIEAGNLLALCRKMGTSLGLRELVDTYGGMSTTSPSSLALQRMTSIAHNTIQHEELIRAYWMTEMLDSISTIGSPYQLGFFPNRKTSIISINVWVWSQTENVIGEHPLRPSHYSSAFSLCVMLALSELQMVQTFLRKPIAMEVFEERDAWQSEAQKIDERLTVWRDEFVAAVYRLINAEKTNIERPEMDPFFVLTNCVLNTAVITLLQRRAPCPRGINTAADSWAFAGNRCVYACENTAFKVRQMSEDEMLNCNPHLIFSIFVAARFYIVHSKALDADVPVNLHSLAFALHVTGKRWQLAKTLEVVIRIAVADYRTPIAQSTVPRNFYDLSLSTLEVMDELKTWAAGVESTGTPGTEEYIMTT